jgi:glyoxalase superfamily protein
MIGSLRAVALDAADIERLAVFYQEFAGWRRLPGDEDDWITLDTGRAWRIGLQLASGHGPEQGGLDIGVPDVDAAVARAERLGATGPTLADPAGHPLHLRPGTGLGVTLDCPDAAVLSAFYTQLIGPAPLRFRPVAGYIAPRWPDPAYPQQIHLDVTVADVEPAEGAVLELGATRLDGAGPNWRVYADPAGKPFCLIWAD